MPLSHIEHFLIQTADIEATALWYADVLGMRRGATPDFGFPVVWMYLGDTDVVHITQGGANVSANRMAYLGQDSQAVRGSGAIDHIAFRCTGLTQMLAHLDATGIDYTKRRVDDQALFQLFMFDPAGIKVELNFASHEADGVRADVMAKDLVR